MHDKVDDLVGLHRADAEHVPRVNKTDAADLHKIPDQLRRGADERVRRGALDLNGVVRHKTVAAAQKRHGVFALADAALARDHHALAVDLHQYAVHRGARGEPAVETHDELCHKIARGVLGGEQRHLMALRRGEHFGRDIHAVRNDAETDPGGDEPLNAAAACLGTHIH